MNRYVVELNDRVWAYLEARSDLFELRGCYCSLDHPQHVILVMTHVHTGFVRDMYAMGICCSIFYKHDDICSMFAVDVWLSLYDTAQP